LSISGSGDELRQTVVADPRDVALEVDVGRLEVEVHERSIVQGLDAARHLHEQPQRGVAVERALVDAIAQGRGARVGHHDVGDAVHLALVFDRHEVGMVDLSEVADRIELAQHCVANGLVVDL
jgi:hypothetical protein